MSADPETLAVYAERATEFHAKFGRERPGRFHQCFLDALSPKSRILDLGCGPGSASRVFADHGHLPDPTDASPEMVQLARDNGLPARLSSFDDINEIAQYDGVWANFSLLHASRASLPPHLAAIHRALKLGGIFHLGMKLGKGEKRDRLGRFYAYFSRKELDTALQNAHFQILHASEFTEVGLAGDPEPGIVILSKAI